MPRRPKKEKTLDDKVFEFALKEMGLKWIVSSRNPTIFEDSDGKKVTMPEVFEVYKANRGFHR